MTFTNPKAWKLERGGLLISALLLAAGAVQWARGGGGVAVLLISGAVMLLGAVLNVATFAWRKRHARLTRTTLSWRTRRALVKAMRAVPRDALLSVPDSEISLSVRHEWPRWTVDEYSRQDLAACAGQWRDGQQLATLPCTRYTYFGGDISAAPRVETVAQDPAAPAGARWIAPRPTVRGIFVGERTSMRMGEPVPEERVLELVGQLRRVAASR